MHNMSQPPDLRHNLQQALARIEAAAKRAHRAADSVTLVAVTKTVEAPVIAQLLQLGVRDIAENRQQTAAAKLPLLADALREFRPRLHFIGPLQRNKVKRVVQDFDCIHSVDSVKLALEISHRALECGRVIDVFIEVNVSGEPQKSGLAPAEVAAALAEIRALPALRIQGLMTMAPLLESPEAARPHFRELARLSTAHCGEGERGLSMGMSGDFEVAIEEGATHVRVGSALYV